MTQASPSSVDQSNSRSRHMRYSSPSCSRSASYPPTTVSTSSAGRASTTSHGAGSILHRFCGFLISPRKLMMSSPSSSSAADRKHGILEAVPEDGTPPTSGQMAFTCSAPRRSAGEEFEKVFRYLDENGDGKVSASELRSRMKAVGQELSAEDAEAVVESTDSDGDGLLGLEDFVKLVDVGGDEEERTRDLREAFAMYEMKGRGCITPKSLRQTLRRLGVPKTTEECKVMIRRFDLNGDGVLSFDEFKLMML